MLLDMTPPWRMRFHLSRRHSPESQYFSWIFCLGSPSIWKKVFYHWLLMNQWDRKREREKERDHMNMWMCVRGCLWASLPTQICAFFSKTSLRLSDIAHPPIHRQWFCKASDITVVALPSVTPSLLVTENGQHNTAPKEAQPYADGLAPGLTLPSPTFHTVPRNGDTSFADTMNFCWNDTLTSVEYFQGQGVPGE